MAYLEPASNPGSKPQRMGATNCKSSPSDKLQTFRTIYGISCKFLTKKLFTWDNTFCFVLKGNLMHEISQNLSGKSGEESMIWEKMSCINGCMVISNLVISLVHYSILCCWRTWWRRLILWDVSSNNFLICTFMSEYNTEEIYALCKYTLNLTFRGLRTCSVTHLTELKVCKKLKKPNVFY